jgi:hypothetical protein
VCWRKRQQEDNFFPFTLFAIWDTPGETRHSASNNEPQEKTEKIKNNGDFVTSLIPVTYYLTGQCVNRYYFRRYVVVVVVVVVVWGLKVPRV